MIALGLYQHYKGTLYRVIGFATESTNDRPREELVLYISDAAHGVCSRTRAEFEEPIEWPDGQTRPRFDGLRRGVR